MNKFQNFTRENKEDVRTLIDAKLAELKELGFDIKLGNMRFDSKSFTSKIECRLKGSSDIYAAAFEKSNYSIGYENAVGQTVVFSGKNISSEVSNLVLVKNMQYLILRVRAICIKLNSV